MSEKFPSGTKKNPNKPTNTTIPSFEFQAQFQLPKCVVFTSSSLHPVIVQVKSFEQTTKCDPN